MKRIEIVKKGNGKWIYIVAFKDGDFREWGPFDSLEELLKDLSDYQKEFGEQ